jgi:hypothetical protein
MPIFDAASLETAVAAQLAAVDLGDQRHAFVAVVTRDADGAIGVTGAIAAKLGDVWAVQAAVAIDHDTRIAGGFAVKAAW